MKISRLSLFLLVNFTVFSACGQKKIENNKNHSAVNQLLIGAEQTTKYFPLLEKKKIAFVGNHTSIINEVHLVDTLLSSGFKLVKVFSPEHGFRGKADAGELVGDGKDEKTNLPIVSLYGKNKKPTKLQLEGVELILFDIQDVGARFYTYISTLHYIMEAAAELNIHVVVLDRPNPNGHYIDGPILKNEFKSFVGMHPVPVVHGMTIGEYAQMINGEKWLANQVQCKLTVVSCKNYSHDSTYYVANAPSPNLPNMKAIYLYPSLCFFEGTPISVGRGTSKPFQQYGHPLLNGNSYSFTPEPTEGAKNPKLRGEKCYGKDFSKINEASIKEYGKINLKILLEVYKQFPKQESFFTSFFTLLAGTDELQKQIQNGMTEDAIRASWKEDLEKYDFMRQKYLLYP